MVKGEFPRQMQPKQIRAELLDPPEVMGDDAFEKGDDNGRGLVTETSKQQQTIDADHGHGGDETVGWRDET